jgi:hypothetical protein
LQFVDLGRRAVVFIDVQLVVRDVVLVEEVLEDAAVRAPVGAEYAKRGLTGRVRSVSSGRGCSCCNGF